MSALFTFRDPDDFRRLREALDRAGYRDKGVLGALGISEMGAIKGTDEGILLRRTRGGSPLETLIRLFLIEAPVDEGALQRAVHPLRVESVAEAGLVETRGGEAVAAVKLIPVGTLWIVFDSLKRLREGSADFVMGVGTSTMTLANLTVRRQAGATLDLGSGCGLHALLASPHSGRVAAVDRNPRAVGMAAFNARLNGLSNIECLEGDLFGPVGGRAFDLVVSNPPFVISPGQRYVYRDSGMRGDEICRKIVREVPRFLNNGGYCQMICNWVENRSEEWTETLRSWFEGTGCDVWVMRSHKGDAETYATVWIRGTELRNTADFAAEFDRWVTYYEEQGIEGMGMGVIAMRRREGASNWFMAEDGPDRMLGACGEAVLRGFSAMDFLETVRDDGALLGARLRAAPDMTLQRTYEPTPEGWSETDVEIRCRQGFVYPGKIDRYVADLITACDGRRSLGEVLAPLTAAVANRSEILSASCRIVRRLVEKGFLRPEDPGRAEGA